MTNATQAQHKRDHRAAMGEIVCRPAEAARLRAMRERIIALYHGADSDAQTYGRRWYDSAEDAAAIVAPADPARGAAIIAALSPRNKWAVNVRQAIAVSAAHKAGAGCPAVSIGRNRAKAWAIARGEDPANVLGGPKVRAFWRNLAGDRSAVTVDVWAARAAEGRRDDRAPTGRRYALIARAYREAAATLGEDPATVQAIVWCPNPGRLTPHELS